MGSFYKQQLNDWVATLDVNAKVVFDIGGAQSPIKGRTKSWDVADYKVVDLITPHVEQQKPDITLDLDQLWFTSDFSGYEEQVDAVFCLGVFDFLLYPHVGLLNIKRLLKEDGYAWIQFPFIYAIHEPVTEEGFRYSEPAIRRLMDKVGLKIEDIVYIRPQGVGLLEFYAKEKMSLGGGVDQNVLSYIVKVRK